MAETSNIARMGEKIFHEIFEVFGWRRVGPAETNWACVKSESHNNRSHHPTDVVFKYDDPYRDHTIYVIVDLKSLGRESITPLKLKGSTLNLCQTVTCAHYGEGWKDLYHVEDSSHELLGLLFVYNHSQDFTNGEVVSSVLSDPMFNDLMVPARQRVALLGPAEVNELHSIAADIRMLRGDRGERALSPADRSFFWHPELVLTRLQTSSPQAATIEMLTSERVIMKSERPGNRAPHYTFWYRDSGETTEEFQYLFDSFFRYQMLNDEDSTIDVRMTQPDSRASTNFEKAKSLYGERFLTRGRLDKQVSYNSVPIVSRRFSEIELGFR